MSDAVTLKPAVTDVELAEVRRLCWDYRAFLLGHSDINARITETFYPVPKYEALMAGLAQAHARPTGIMLLAQDAEGAAIGCGMSHALDAQTSEIKRVFVAPEARGKGVASTLCAALVDRARKDGFARVVLDTSRNLTGAAALYDRLGFTRRGPYQDIPADLLPHLLFFEKTIA